MKKILVITADQGDSDFISKITEISDDKVSFIEKMCKIITPDGYWPTGERADPRDIYDIYSGKADKNEIREFNSFAPYGHWGIRAIVSLQILTVIEDKRLI